MFPLLYSDIFIVVAYFMTITETENPYENWTVSITSLDYPGLLAEQLN